MHPCAPSVATVWVAVAMSAVGSAARSQAGTRDPFVAPTSSLNARPECRGTGLTALRIDELAPTGIVALGAESRPGPGVRAAPARHVRPTHKSIPDAATSRYRRTRWALLVGPDGRSHVAHVGTRLCDGSVTAITSEAVSFEPLVGGPGDGSPGARTTKVLHSEGEAR